MTLRPSPLESVKGWLRLVYGSHGSVSLAKVASSDARYDATPVVGNLLKTSVTGRVRV